MGRLGLPAMGLQNRRPTAMWTPTSISAVAWWDTDLGVTLGTPPAVAALADQSGNAHHATQGVAATQGTLTALGPGGRSSISGDGTDFYDNAISLGVGTDHTIVTGVYLPTPINVIANSIFADSTGNNICLAAYRGALADFRVSIYTGAYRQSDLVVTPGTHVETFVFDGGANTCLPYLDGVAASAPLVAPAFSFPTSTIFYGFQPLIGAFWKIAYWNRMLTSAERILAELWAAT